MFITSDPPPPYYGIFHIFYSFFNPSHSALVCSLVASHCTRVHCTPPVVLSLGAGAERLVTRDQFYVWSLPDDYGSRTEITPIGRIDSSSAL